MVKTLIIFGAKGAGCKGGECSELEEAIIGDQQQGCIGMRVECERVRRRETTEGLQRKSIARRNIFKENRRNVKRIRGGGGVTKRSFSNQSAASRHDNSGSRSENCLPRSIFLGGKKKGMEIWGVFLSKQDPGDNVSTTRGGKFQEGSLGGCDSKNKQLHLHLV